MPEPINPEDHSICGEATVNAVRVNQSWTSWHLALTEAIHQTFERDAQPENEFRVNTERWEACDPATEETSWTDSRRQTRRHPDGQLVYNPILHGRQDDPHTEIDRLARLIVDGEYRRRSQADA